MSLSLQRLITFLGAVAVGIFGIATFTSNGAAEGTHPPHAERREAVSPNQGDYSPLPEVQGWIDSNALIAEEESRQAEEARLAAEVAAAEEAARMKEQQQIAQQAPSPVAVSQTGPDGACDGINWVVPVYIVYRESHCNFLAVNQNGCGGYSCVGAYQFDRRHWIPREEGGWGGCADLGDWQIPANQHECASRMSRGGTYLAPWGG